MLPRPGKAKKFQTNGTVYQPSIYSYTCRGAFSLSSDDPGSEGVCRGIRSRLELLMDMEPGTREAAVKSFLDMTDYEVDDADANGLNQKTKSILISPAIIYKEQPTGDGNDTDATTRSPPLLEEELIRRQQWSCYGSTEVDLLVLKDERRRTEHVAAVAPRNAGLSIRRIETDEGHISSIGIGWVNIVVDTGPLVDDPHAHAAPRPAAPVPDPSGPLPRRSGPQRGGEDLPDNVLSPATPEVPPKPSPGSIQQAKTHLTNVYQFSLKVGEHMKHNATWLLGTLQDDFPSRCAASGKRIVAEMPRTASRTAAYMGRMYERWASEGDDDDDENNGGKRAGR